MTGRSPYAHMLDCLEVTVRLKRIVHGAEHETALLVAEQVSDLFDSLRSLCPAGEVNREIDLCREPAMRCLALARARLDASSLHEPLEARILDLSKAIIAAVNERVVLAQQEQSRISNGSLDDVRA